MADPGNECFCEINCQHFLRGKCRHGFNGKKKVGDIEECPYKHPIVCKKLMDYGHGPKGCNDEKNCGKIHPFMCRNSIRKGSCQNMGPGKRCSNGYHVRGTKPLDSDNSGENSNDGRESYRDKLAKNSTNNQVKLSNEQKTFLMDFLMRIAGSL